MAQASCAHVMLDGSSDADDEFLRSLCRASARPTLVGGGADGADNDDEFLRTLCRADRRPPLIHALDDAPASSCNMSSLYKYHNLPPVMTTPSASSHQPSTRGPQQPATNCPKTESWKVKVARLNDGKRDDIGVPSLNLGIKDTLIDDDDDDDDSSCQSPRAFDDVVADERRSVRLHSAISFEEALSQDREICAAQLRRAVDACSLFYIGTTINVLRRWTGGMMQRGYMDGHAFKWQRMRVIGIRGEGGASKKLEEFLIDVGKSEYGSKCANVSRKAIGQCRRRPNFLYVCMELRKHQ
jgi:hypothetical protein